MLRSPCATRHTPRAMRHAPHASHARSAALTPPPPPPLDSLSLLALSDLCQRLVERLTAFLAVHVPNAMCSADDQQAVMAGGVSVFAPTARGGEHGVKAAPMASWMGGVALQPLQQAPPSPFGASGELRNVGGVAMARIVPDTWGAPLQRWSWGAVLETDVCGRAAKPALSASVGAGAASQRPPPPPPSFVQPQMPPQPQLPQSAAGPPSLLHKLLPGLGVPSAVEANQSSPRPAALPPPPAALPPPPTGWGRLSGSASARTTRCPRDPGAPAAQQWLPSLEEVEAQLRMQLQTGPSYASQQCAYCSTQGAVYLDASDGQRYCGSCWRIYYGCEPAPHLQAWA